MERIPHLAQDSASLDNLSEARAQLLQASALRLAKPDTKPDTKQNRNIKRDALCGLGQPQLTQALYTPRFLFQEASLIWVTSGSLAVSPGSSTTLLSTGATLTMFDQSTFADIKRECQKFCV